MSGTKLGTKFYVKFFRVYPYLMCTRVPQAFQNSLDRWIDRRTDERTDGRTDRYKDGLNSIHIR